MFCELKVRTVYEIVLYCISMEPRIGIYLPYLTILKYQLYYISWEYLTDL